MSALLATALAATLAPMAIVVQDNTALRAAPSAAATAQAQLVQGDLLEVRGQRLDHLQVYDHQRERAGFVRATQLRPLELKESEAPQLLAVLRFLRDTPGAEPLGIAYVAAYLKTAPAATLTAEPFDALGVMAERLARRASAKNAPSASVASHLEAAGRYGVKFIGFEREGAMQLCYDGEAFNRVLTMPATAEQQARAVLALTRHDCIDPTLPPQRKQARDRWRAELLDRLGAAQFAQLDEPARNRVQMRRAGVWAAITFARSREEGAGAAAAAHRALDALAAVNKQELGDEEQTDYAEAAVRVGASRWAAEAPAAQASSGRLTVKLQPGEPGQTCVQLVRQAGAAVSAATALGEDVRRCTYGTVWAASARSAPDGKALALQVQPLEGWTELWVFRASAPGWTVDVLPPAASEPGLGYAEFAGWAPGPAPKLLLVRESRTEGRLRRSFEVLALDTLAVDKQASTPQLLSAFNRWQDAAWKRGTVALR